MLKFAPENKLKDTFDDMMIGICIPWYIKLKKSPSLGLLISSTPDRMPYKNTKTNPT
jgi:hypothetical protein